MLGVCKIKAIALNIDENGRSDFAPTSFIIELTTFSTLINLWASTAAAVETTNAAIIGIGRISIYCIIITSLDGCRQPIVSVIRCIESIHHTFPGMLKALGVSKRHRMTCFMEHDFFNAVIVSS